MLHYTFKIVILLLMLISPMTLLAQIQARDSVRKDTVKQEEKKTVKYTLKELSSGIRMTILYREPIYTWEVKRNL